MISLTSGTPVTQSPTVAVVVNPDEVSKSESRTSFNSASSGHHDNRTEQFLDKAKFLTSVRKYVSGPKTTRVSDAGFDLDMSYITPRIIAMGFPASGLEATIRNPRHQVVAYLRKRHPGKYLVFNLCGPEKRWIYSSSEFAHDQARDGAVIIPIKDGNVPSLYQMTSFCQQALSWLNLDKENLVVVHCTSGRARTGIMVCALLLATRACASADEAIALFTSTRSQEGDKKIFVPSKMSVIKLFEELLQLSSLSVPIAITSLGLARYSWTLESLEIGLPEDKAAGVVILNSIIVRRRSEEEGSKLVLPELYKVKNPTHSRFTSMVLNKISQQPVHSPIHITFPPDNKFTSNEDVQFTINLRNGYTRKFSTSFWYFSEVSEQMINHKSLADNASTTILSVSEIDNVPAPLKSEQFYIKINVRYIRI